MSARASGTFESTSWDEQPYSEVEGAPKLSATSAGNRYRGDFEGEGTQKILTYYADDSHGSYTGMERMIGRLAGRSGSFVLQHRGVFDEAGVRGEWSVVPGSGSGELAGLRGEGRFIYATGEKQTSYAFDYSFA
jgi:hypothetical protein